MKVVATKQGFYNGQVRQKGDSFTLEGKDKDSHFSRKWMKRVRQPSQQSPQQPLQQPSRELVIK